MNQLPADRIPTIEQLNAVFPFKPNKSEQVGNPKLLGKDEFNNEIYTIDFGLNVNIGLQTAYFFLNEHSNLLEWKFFDIRTPSNTFFQFGRLLYQLHLVNLGQQMLIRGIQSCYLQISNQVNQIKELCKNFG